MSTIEQRAKTFGLVAIAVFAIVAFASASASAATWTAQRLKLPGEGTAHGENAHSVLKTGTVASIAGTALGQQILITATTLTTPIGTIFQEGAKAKDSETFELTGVTIDSPVGCGISSTLKSRPLTSELVDHSGSTHVYDKFFPEEGELIATIKITGCAVAGSYNLQGVFYGEGENWGTALINQPLKFNDAINTTLGGTLLLGSCDAELTAETVTTLESGWTITADT